MWAAGGAIVSSNQNTVQQHVATQKAQTRDFAPGSLGCAWDQEPDSSCVCVF